MSFAHTSINGSEIARNAFPGIPVALEQEKAEYIWKGVCSNEAAYYQRVKDCPPKHLESVDEIPGFQVIRHQSYTEVRSLKKNAPASSSTTAGQLGHMLQSAGDSLDDLISGRCPPSGSNHQVDGGQEGAAQECGVDSASLGKRKSSLSMGSMLNLERLTSSDATHKATRLEAPVDQVFYRDVLGKQRTVKRLINNLGNRNPNVQSGTREFGSLAAPNNSLAATRDLCFPRLGEAGGSAFQASVGSRRAVRFNSEASVSAVGEERRPATPAATIRPNVILQAPRAIRSEGPRDLQARLRRLAAAASAKECPGAKPAEIGTIG